jgi:stage III sporulation protein AA
MLDFLPSKVKESIKHLNIQYLYEIRIRMGQPIRVNIQGKYCYLGSIGCTKCKENALICTFDEIADCVYRAGRYSVYSIEEQIKQGFLTAESGERIGLAGEYVFENGKVLTLRNITSLCIRIPHEVISCGQKLYDICMSDRVENLLIVSPPGIGKTTLLRDLGRIISKNTAKNILICDERGELAMGAFGDTCDVVKYADKETAFIAGIRAMRPDIIITDELLEKDCEVLERAVFAGVKVLASAHFYNIENIEPNYKKIFDYIAILEEDSIGKVKGIYRKIADEMVKIC